MAEGRLLDRSKCFRRGQPLAKSTKNCVLMNSETLGPFCHTQRYAIVRNHSVGSLVSVLFRFCSPAAVAWLVISVVVGIAINGVLVRWASAHVCEEVLERVQPAVADRNSSSAVIAKLLGGTAATSLDKAYPGIVFWRSEGSACSVSALFVGSVGGISSCGHLGVVTPTTPRQVSGKISSVNNCDNSTIAAAFPAVVVSDFSSVADHLPAIELLCGEVYESRAAWNVCHSGIVAGV